MKRALVFTVAILLASFETAHAQDSAPLLPPAPADDITKMPVVKHFVEAPYPLGATTKRVEAVVKLSIDIDASGAVEDARVESVEGGEGFDFAAPALSAVRRFQFEPAEANGVPVPVTINYLYRFALPKPRAAPPPTPETPQAAGEYDILVEDEKKSDGRVVTDPASAMPNTPRTSGSVVAQSGNRPAARGGGRGGGRPGGGRPGGGGGGGRPGGGGGPPGGGGGPPGGGRPGGGGGGRFGGGGAGAAQGATGAVTAGSDAVSAVTLENGLVMRGLAPSMTRVVVDGIDVPMAYHLGAIRPILPVGLLEQATFYQGSFPLEYGRADGGLVVLDTNHELAPRITGYADANWADLAGMVRAPLTKSVTVSLSGQYSMLDQVLGAVVPRNDTSLAAIPRYRDGEIQLVYQPDSTFRATLLGIASSDQLVDWFGDASTRGDLPAGTPTFSTTFYRAIGSSEWTPSKRVTVRMTVGGGLEQTFQDDPSFDIRLVKVQARPSARFVPWDNFAIDMGAEYVVERLDGTASAAAFPNPTAARTGTQTLTQTTGESLAGHLGVDWELLKDLHVLPGARVEHYSTTSETALDPRLFAKWTILKGHPGLARLGLKASVGGYHRPPSLLETNVELGNPTLTAESATHWLVGADYAPVKGVDIGIDGFYVYVANAIVRSTGTRTENGGMVPEVFSNGGTARTRGLELFVDAQLAQKLEGWLYYTYSVSDISTDGGTTTLPSSFDQTHVLGTAVSYALPDNWKIRSRFQYATGFPITTITGGVFDSTTNTYTQSTGATLGDRAPDFIQLDARVEKSWALGRATRLTAYVDVRNVFNRANVVAPYAYDYDYRNRFARTGLPILPMAGLRGDF